MERQNLFTVKIGGQAGQGIKSAGLMLAKLAARSGYDVYNHTEYPSQIRGGHNVIQVNISAQGVSGPNKVTDLLVALDLETVDCHKDELVAGSGILFGAGNNLDTAKLNQPVNLFPVPLLQLVADAGGNELLSNTIAIGAVTALLGGDINILKGLVGEEYGEKGVEIASANQKAAELGFNFATQHFADKVKKVLSPLENMAAKIVVNGNDAVALGAIAGGVQFAAIYPMSPISNILHTLALYQEKYGYVYKQPEDEIAAVNMAIGAAFAGARAMTATSGGGFSLMVEGYGLAGMTETPLVIIEGMRPGPATGLPTWSGQGDLQFVLHAHQDDFPRIVLVAGDAKEAFDLTMQAFNLAEKYQTPVILLIDKNICENEQSFPVFDILNFEVNRGKLTTQNLPNYQRYAPETDGVSPRSIPGVGNFFIANSYEHNSVGFTSEEIKDINTQMGKRMNKLKSLAAEMPAPQLFGAPEAALTFVSWGSNKGNILQAIKNFNNVNFLHLIWLSPFPTEAVKNILAKTHHLVDVECNYSGQLAKLIREKTGIEIADQMLKFDGRPFYPEDIIEKINQVLNK